MFHSDLKIQFEGKVIKGVGRGKRIGFPTINVVTATDLDLAYGVYFCSVECPKGEFYGAMHYGPRPTFNDSATQCEIYLLDFEGDLMGEYVKVCVFDYLRDVRKFNSEEELKDHIQADILRIRDIIG